MKTRNVIILLLVILLLAGAIYVAFNGLTVGSMIIPSAKSAVDLGLDLKGGVYVLLEAQTDATGEELQKIMEQSKAIITNRVDGLGVSEPNIAIEGGNRLRIELAGLTNSDEALSLIGKTAQLQFVDPDGNVVVTGKEVKDSQVTIQQAQGGNIGQNIVVSLEFNKEGAEAFKEATTRLAPTHGIITIMLDDKVISAPSVSTPIPDGIAVIQGNFTIETAKNLATLIRAGALPVEMKTLSTDVQGPTLGMNAFETSVMCGGIALLFIFLFMIVYYRIPGFVASMALIIYVLITIIALVVIKAKLTLPGIAGLVLSVGMAVDANVIIFERIKEELKVGKSIRTAIDSGFNIAFRTILDSNITTVIAGSALVYFGVGPIRGFGVTLIIGIVSSMFTAVFISKHLLKLFSNIFDKVSNKAYGAR